jgi:hypothetical protein
MSSKRKNPNDLTNGQRHRRIEVIDRRISELTIERKLLTELIVADLHTPKA